MRRRICCYTFILLLCACSGAEQPHVLEGFAQGTTYHISFYPADTAVDSEQLRSAVTAELDEIDRAMSGYRSDSTIEQFNQAKDTDPHTVGSEIGKLVEIAAEIGAASGGCYDLTVKPLFDLWGFKDDRFSSPDARQIKEVMQHIGMAGVDIQLPDRLRKQDPAIQIDLSSIAQGYTAARLADILDRAGIRDYMVEIGGEVVVAGQKPGGAPWRIAIERPLPGDRAVEKVVSIGGAKSLAVVTSGTYRHYFDEDGVRYSHILDARTGYPVQHDTVSVTVFHEDASYADAWSMALLCLGAEAGMPLANRLAIPALFIQQHDHELTETQSDALLQDAGLSIE